MPSPHRLPQPQRTFLSAKAATTIAIKSDLHHDALRQCALDPKVTRIEYFACVRLGTIACPIGATAVIRDGRRLVLEIGDRPEPRDLDQEGLYLLALEKLNATPLVLSSRELLREPHCSNCRLVWSYNSRRVPASLRDRILRVVDGDGSITVQDLCRDLGSDLTAHVYALACRSALHLELDGLPLAGTTVVGSKHLRASELKRHRVGRGPQSA
jgi:hypothetical protein